MKKRRGKQASKKTRSNRRRGSLPVGKKKKTKTVVQGGYVG